MKPQMQKSTDPNPELSACRARAGSGRNEASHGDNLAGFFEAQNRGSRWARFAPRTGAAGPSRGKLASVAVPMALAVLLAGGYSRTEETGQQNGPALAFLSPVSGHLYFEPEAVELEVRARPGSADATRRMRLSCSLTTLWGEKLKTQEVEIVPEQAEELAVSISFGQPGLGYYDVEALLLDGENVLHRAATSVGVVRSMLDRESSSSPLGICLYYHPELEAAARAGIRWARLDFPWPHCEWKEEGFEWVFFDGWVNEAKSLNVKIDAVLVQTPDWASQAPEDVPRGTQFTPKSLASYKDYAWTYPPKKMADWERFVTAVVERYRGRVQHWEMWNESDFIFWWGSYEEYAALLKAGHLAAKKADPKCQVLLAGPAWIHGLRVAGRVFDSPTWLQACLQDEGKRFVDVLNFHSYGDVPYLLGKVDEIRRIARAEKCEKPIWCTETGFNSGGSRHGELRQCEYLVKMVASLLAEGVPRVFWWEARDDPIQFYPTSGLFRADGSPKPSAVAVNALLSVLEDASFVQRALLENQVEAFFFARQDSNLAVLWRNGPPVTHAMHVGQTGPLRLIDITGSARTITPANGRIEVSVSTLPVFLEGLPRETLQVSRLAYFDKPVFTLLSGQPTRVPLNVVNVLEEPVEGRVRILAPKSWDVAPPEQLFELQKGETRALPFQVTAPPDSVPCFQPLRAVLDLSVESAGQVGSPVTARVIPPIAMTLEPLAEPLSPGRRLVLNLRNQMRRTIFGRVSVTPSAGWSLAETEIEYAPVEPFATTSVTYTVREVSAKPAEAEPEIEVTATGTGGEVAARRSLPLDFAVCRRARTPPRIDGNLPDWEGALPMHLGRIEQALLGQQPWDWKGPADLSGVVYTLWDENHFYLAARVTDDIAGKEDWGQETWQGDSFHFALDTGLDRGPFQDDNDYEFIAAPTPYGPVCWSWYTPEGRSHLPNEKVQIAIRSGGKNTLVYELAVPYSEIAKLKPVAGLRIGFAALLTDNDGFGRRGWLEWGSGLGGRKCPKDYAELHFTGQE
ncbi:MAG: hypothetical protein HYU36_19915 [Planctomycetes bacterium]|nr:hypothetical protein [Planctomycetota bacterium]